jgi:hypothetical protein
MQKVYKKRKGASKHIWSIQKWHQKQKKEGREEKHPQNPKTGGNPNNPTKTSPQNPETITSQQVPSCLSPTKIRTPGIIIDRVL